MATSQEEAIRAAQERDAALAAEAAAAIPPVPNYQPPLPPSSSPSGQSRVGQQAGIPELAGEEDDAPERVLRTVITGPPNNAGTGKASHNPNAPATAERRETTVLPVVEEAMEGTSTGDRSGTSRVSSLTTDSKVRPLTPAKEGDELAPGFGNPLLSSRNGSRGSSFQTRPPPTPPKTGHGYIARGKPESADSGYGVGASGSSSNGGLKSLTGSQRSLGLRPQISRDSLDKALPPLPNGGHHRSQNVS